MKSFFKNRAQECIAVALIALVLGLTSIITTGNFRTAKVFASSGGNISGWAWSDNLGWVSFNSSTDGSPYTYGVNVDTTNEASGGAGALSGYAWSDNVGWISFNGTGAQVNWSTGNITGNAQVVVAPVDGWDGVISLSGASPAYGITINKTTGQLTGWAWGGGDNGATAGVGGWISFSNSTDGSGVSYGVTGPLFCANGANNPPTCSTCTSPLVWSPITSSCVATCGNGANNPPTCWNSCTSPLVWSPITSSCVNTCANGANNPPTCNTCVAPLIFNGSSCVMPAPPTVNFSANPSSGRVGVSSTLIWSASSATSCNASWNGAEPLSGSASVGPLTAGSHSYTLTCTGPGGSTPASATVTVAAAVCGNGFCESGETTLSCPTDCKTKVQQF